MKVKTNVKAGDWLASPAGSARPWAEGLGILNEGVHQMKVKTSIKAGLGGGEGGWPGF
jgi:hypothetical protein